MATFSIRCVLPVLFLFIAPALHAQDSNAFSAADAPPAPDYANPAYWAALPGAPGATAAVPEGLSFDPEIKNTDVFYIHPTTLKDKSVWNQTLSDETTNHWTDVSVMARQASVFNDCCTVIAPRYRQASFKSGGDPTLSGDGGKAYRLAYSDVLAAFDYYMTHMNKGKPFIIAGHSQGALMTYWLLKDRIDGKPAQQKMVAAYIIGIDLMQGDFGRTYKTLSLCSTPEQTGCVLAWNAGTKDLDIDKMSQFAGSRYAYTYNTQEGRNAVCVNPLTFDTSKPEAPAGASKGAVPGAPGEGKVNGLVKGAVAAKCHRGYLIVDFDPALNLSPSFGGSMHYHEFGLFYADIRDNIAKRITAFEK